jgi:hypothetical protein
LEKGHHTCNRMISGIFRPLSTVSVSIEACHRVLGEVVKRLLHHYYRARDEIYSVIRLESAYLTI